MASRRRIASALRGRAEDARFGLQSSTVCELACWHGVESEAVDEVRDCCHGGGVVAAQCERDPVGCSGGTGQVFDLVVAEVVEGLRQSGRCRRGITDADAGGPVGVLELG
jgi:hypothetical protein